MSRAQSNDGHYVSGGRSRRVWPTALLAMVASIAVIAGACGGGSDEADNSGANNDDVSTPVDGGELIYALEAENSGGWCLPEAQLDASGIIVARAIYDTLTVPNEDGDYVPFLAESVEPNDDFSQWTIKLRDGVTFHDGTALDATVVKNNLDAYRGAYPARKPLLLLFAFQNVASVDVVDDLTLTVTTNTPWPSLPAALYYTGRVGIMAQAQLDDPDTCDRNLIGTGPFMLEDWVVNEHLTTTKNPDYWGTDSEGRQLPYLDGVEFQPFPEGASRTNALLSGQINALHTTSAPQTEVLLQEQDAGNVKVWESGEYAEVTYGMLNVSKPPFDNPIAREAAALAFDRDQVNDVAFLGMSQIANGPFAPGAVGYLEDTGYPAYDPDRAAELVQEYARTTGQPLEFTLTIPNTEEPIQIAQLLQKQVEAVGAKMNVKTVEQATLITQAIAGDFQAIAFRNHPGGDPDSNYVWWYGGSPLNFGRFDDPEINALLDQGRVEADPDKRQEIYADINREFAKKHYDLWLIWNDWVVATADNVHGIEGPPNPDGSGPFPGLADTHSLAGTWID